MKTITPEHIQEVLHYADEFPHSGQNRELAEIVRHLLASSAPLVAATGYIPAVGKMVYELKLIASMLSLTISDAEPSRMRDVCIDVKNNLYRVIAQPAAVGDDCSVHRAMIENGLLAGQVAPQATVEPLMDERAAFAKWALEVRVAYRDDQGLLHFYNPLGGAHQLIGWEARALFAATHITSKATEPQQECLARNLSIPDMPCDTPLNYARFLAAVLWRDYYKDTSVDFTLLPDAIGVLSQIDNMLTGIKRPDLSTSKADTGKAKPDYDFLAWRLIEVADRSDKHFGSSLDVKEIRNVAAALKSATPSTIKEVIQEQVDHSTGYQKLREFIAEFEIDTGEGCYALSEDERFVVEQFVLELMGNDDAAEFISVRYTIKEEPTGDQL